MVDIARLGLAIESAEAEKGASSLDRLTNAAGRAEAAARGVSSGFSNASSMAAEAAQRHGLLAGIIDRVSAAFRAAVEAGRGWISSLRNTGQAVDRVVASAGAARANTANIAAQFQDIAVSANMGMGALQIGLQQGTQLASVITAMENPVKGLGAAFLSVLSPVSLLVIGLTALAAAGLQNVDWAVVAKDALNGVADVLVTIAPYAALAAAGLALVYAPSIIAGIGSVVTGLWGMVTALYAAIGLPALLVAGFVALVAAAVVWRDDLTKMLGFDIVQVAEDAINNIIGFFVGAFNAIKDTWGLIPDAFKDIFTMAMNNSIDIVQNGVNGIISALKNIPGLGGIADVDLSGFKGTVTGAAGQVGSIISSDFANAQGQNYVGAAVKGLQDFASDAADKLRGLSGSLQGTDAAADKLGNTVNGPLTDGFDRLTTKTNAWAQAATSAFSNMGTTLIDAFRQGGDVAQNVLSALINKVGQFGESLLNSGLNNLLQMGVSAITSAITPTGGAWNGGLWGSAIFAGVHHSGGVAGYPSAGRMVPAWMFADAPRYHGGGIAGLRPDEVPAILQRGERVVPASRNASQGGDYLDVHVTTEVQNGNLVPVMVQVAGQVAGQTVKQQAPAVVAKASLNNRRG